MKIKVSIKSLNQKFHPCTIDYILKTCKGRCCQGTNKILVTIHDSELKKFKDKKVGIEKNFLIPDNRGLCPFKNNNGICNIHNNKPLGCRFSPFTLNKNGTLIIRNRYRLLKCYNVKDSLPAYISHKESLLSIVSIKNYNYILKNLDRDFIYIEINNIIYNILIDNDKYKKIQN